MQNALLFFLNLIYKCTSRIDERIKNLIIQIILISYALMFALMPASEDIGNRMVVCSIGLVVMMCASIKKELHPVEINRIALYSMMGFGFGILLIGQIHYVGNGYMMFGIQLLLILPAFYFVWINRGDFESLYDKIALALILAGFIEFGHNFCLACKGQLEITETGRVVGSNNPNFLGMTGLTMLMSSQYISLKTDSKVLSLIIAIASGLGMSMMIESASRTSILGTITSTIILLVFVIKNRKSADRGIYSTPQSLVPVIIIALMTTLAGLHIDEIHQNAMDRIPEGYVIKTASLADIPEDSSNVRVERLIEGDNPNNFSSGRIDIWKAYLRELNLLGNNYKDFKKAHPELPASRAHNNFLDYAFRCGMPVMILYLAFFLVLGIKALIKLISNAERSATWFFVIAVTGIYAVYSMIEIATLTFIRVVPCVFFLSAAPLIGAEPEQGDK